MSQTASPGAVATFLLTGAPVGLTGTLTIRVMIPPTTIVRAESTVGIVEGPTGVYSVALAVPTVAGSYLVVWRNGTTETVEDLTVTPAATATPTGSAWWLLAEIRAVRPLEQAQYTDARLEAARQLVQADLEVACGVRFTPTVIETTVIRGACFHSSSTIVLPPRPRAITALTVEGQPATVPTGLEYDASGVVWSPTAWPSGRLRITASHGYDAPPTEVKRVAMMLAKRVLVDSPGNDRATSITNPDGTNEFLLVAGRGGARYDLPAANAAVRRYGVTGAMIA